ncbi:MAG: ubiquinol-cytochrome C reductase [SAR86 cluster bacterium]|uniref:Cytochrome b n=1 Tax=SAR86 cluster bacterium TaxID=2030880 RepID=A0A2A4MSH0_9GAMM|nr:MAG: ubiquinol-cytochrome C reductase [SAR86 cluster bacterium]
MLADLRDWTDERLPIINAWNKHMGQYYAPKNFNFWYFFGVLSLFVLVMQLLTGVWLTMNYTPSSDGAFASIEYIMRDVEWGWLLRYLHSTGASAFFVVVYIHMFRGLMYGSYKKPRELIWVFGMAIYLILMMEGFMGYVLPWGQLSYWGANVIVSLVGAIPVIGDDLLIWVRGDYLISGATLNRFFALHVIALPIVLLALVVLHLLALHEVGSNNPDGVEIKKYKDENGVPLDGVPFHPYYTIYHDFGAIIVFLFVFCFIVFFMPEMGGYFLEVANFQEADNLKTPDHVPPVWYFTPFYSMLRAVTYPLLGIDAKFWGLIVMFGAIAILFVLPWLDKSPVKSMRYKGWYSRIALLMFLVSFFILGVLGTMSVSPGKTLLAQVMTVVYFAYFFAMPWYTRKEQTFTVPDRVTMGRWISIPQLIASIVLLLLLIVLPLMMVSGSAEASEANLDLEHVSTDFDDKDSLQRGFKTYMNYCVSCHELGYARYERTADDLEIPHDMVMENLVFGDESIGDLITNAMSEDNAKAWFAAVPPDLTLIARVRGADWLYSYFNAFYTDTSRPFGANNKIYPNVAMPNVLAELQGEVVCESHGDEHGECELSHVAGTGSLDEAEFDQVTADLANFLYYIGEPIRARRKEIGVWVLAFLAIFYIFAALMSSELVKEYHRKNDKS